MLSLAFGGLVVCLGLRPFLERGSNLNLAKAHRDIHHSSVAGQREAVDRLDDLVGLLAREAKVLRERERRQRPDHMALESRSLQGHELRPRFTRLGLDDLQDRVSLRPGVLVHSPV